VKQHDLVVHVTSSARHSQNCCCGIYSKNAVFDDPYLDNVREMQMGGNWNSLPGIWNGNKIAKLRITVRSDENGLLGNGKDSVPIPDHFYPISLALEHVDKQ